jgi:predicted RNase H-like HicB family nuclease
MQGNFNEIIFVAHEAEEGGYYAKAIELPIFTQADSLVELRVMIKDAVECHFEDASEKPRVVHLLLTHNEVIAI